MVLTSLLNEMVILCIFVLLYRTFVIKQDETQTVQRMTTSPAEEPFFFFLIGTENVKTILSLMKPCVCVCVCITAVMKTADEE